MTDITVLPFADGLRIVVPNTLELITPYVLREQEDFFEDELRFVRGLLQAGQNVVDIGANYGVYTLTMAQKVGPDGNVWAFEPASLTAHFLAMSIAENAFRNVTLEQKALSKLSGSAQLALQRDPELNSIIHGELTAGDSETVTLVTLDECVDRYAWRDIDFVKIDAEGEENNIVKGGGRFFVDFSPLVQYELRRDAATVNFALVEQFAALGYDSYRLVPGLDILVPFDAKLQPDPYLLNLFCCNADRANRLAARGVLLRVCDVAGRGRLAGLNVNSKGDADFCYHWSNALSHLPYAELLTSAWKQTEEDGASSVVIRALAFYSRSRDAALSPLDRFRALEDSFSTLSSECKLNSVRLRLATLARIAHDYGARFVSVSALTQLLKYIRHAVVDPNEPFLPPRERFDSVPYGTEFSSWLVAAVLEQLETREYYSTFYVGAAALERLEDIHALGFGSPEMQRRLDLVRLRIQLGRQPANL